jgi:rubrerythrin
MMIPGLKGEPTERHEFGLWMFEENAIWGTCTACVHGCYDRPTRFCPYCGAYMLNHVEAIEEFERRLPHAEVKTDD